MRRVECTDQEKWVLKQLEQGKDANLKNQFGEDAEQRRLRSRFLEALLTDDIKDFRPHRRGIRIYYAVVAEPLDLENAEIHHIVRLFQCTFQAAVNFKFCRFNKILSLEGSHFRQKADFHRFCAVGDFLCREAVFHGPVDFASAHIGGQFSAQKTHFLSQNGVVIFNGIRVGSSLFIDEAIFEGAADFTTADIGGQFNAHCTHFQKEVTFNSMKVGLPASFKGATFQGQVDFQLIRVNDNFFINSFSDRDKRIHEQTIFKKSVKFAGANIAGQFRAEKTRFESDKDEVIFNGINVGQDAFFSGAEFMGPVDFSGAEIGGQLLALGVKFEYSWKEINLNPSEINFNGLKVGRDAVFNGSFFAGSVNFEKILVKEGINFYKTIFKNGVRLGGLRFEDSLLLIQ